MNLRTAQREAVKAARAVGAIMRGQLASAKRVLKTTQHDIKLELDVRCQKLIERRLHSAFPDIGLIGEEGVAGNPKAEHVFGVGPPSGYGKFSPRTPHTL